MKKIVKLLIICLIITGCGIKYETIDANKAMTIINEESNTVIIDVRSSEEYNEGHIKNAINIPLDEIKDINYNKETNIILYCATGVRSSEAAKELSSLGYTKIYNLDGGLLNWGFELED